MRVVAIIPARYASKRFPGKPLVPIAGKPMIQRVWERSILAERIDEVVVATDDERIVKTVEGFGGKAFMTSQSHESGTERSAEASEKMDAQIIVNVQGDEPLIDPKSLDAVIEPFIDDEALGMSTLKFPLESYPEFKNPNVVKVVCDEQDNALYFSRSPIPCYRHQSGLLERWEQEGKRPRELQPAPMKHIGVYAYRTEFLQAVSRMPKTHLELAERLEQIRALAWGFRIKAVSAKADSVSVDVPEDVKKVEALIGRE